MRLFRPNVVALVWHHRAVLIALIAMSLPVCAAGCSNKSSNDAAGTAAQPAAGTKPATVAKSANTSQPIDSAKPVAATTPAGPSTPVPPSYGATKDIFFVTLGASRTTLNDQPIEPADLPKAFETAWNDYAAARAKQNLAPTFSLDLDEAEPAKTALTLFAHVRKTKGCVVRMTSKRRTQTAEAEDPQTHLIEFRIGDEQGERESRQRESIEIRCRATSSGRLVELIMGSALFRTSFAGDTTPLRDLAELIAFKQEEAEDAGQDPPRLEWVVDDFLVGRDFLATGFALSTRRVEARFVPYPGFISPISATDPALNSELKPEHRITPSTTLNPANSVVPAVPSNTLNPPSSTPSRP